jgi:hypothetical protein
MSTAVTSPMFLVQATRKIDADPSALNRFGLSCVNEVEP